MSKTPNFDAKIKIILDSTKLGERVCPLTGKKWFLTAEEFELFRSFQVPPNEIEPTTMLDFLGGFNTGLAAFWKPHAKTGKPILAAIHPDSPFKALPYVEWQAEDHTFFGREVDFSRSVMEQIWDLETVVPFDAARNIDVDENSVAIASIKIIDSHLIFGSYGCQRCFYASSLGWGEDCIDIGGGGRIFRTFASSASSDIAESMYIFHSRTCHSSFFLFDCQDCEYCFGATNQHHKKYIFFNRQLTKDEYEQKIKNINLSNRDTLENFLDKFYQLWREEGAWPPNFNVRSEDCDGEELEDCVKCNDGYFVIKSNDCLHLRFSFSGERNLYISGNVSANSCYMTTGSSQSMNLKFCQASAQTINSEYCINCLECENCFACVNLFRKKFCIFNKQYSEEEYWQLVDQLKCKMLDDGEYGKFFAAKYSIPGFQFSGAALSVGYSEEDLKLFKVPILDPTRGQVLSPNLKDGQMVKVSDIPDNFSEIDPNKFVGVPIFDPEVGRSYSVTKAEYEIYKAKHWPFPRRHFVTRITDLFLHRNLPVKEKTTCFVCQQPVVTYKNVKFPVRKVYCRECYLKFLEEHS